MRLKSLKMLKLPAIVICMLAAGICYSCGGQDGPENGAMVLDLDENGTGDAKPVDAGAGNLENGSAKTAGTEGVIAGNTEGVKAGSTEGVKAGSTGQGPTVFVHVCGRVRKPGVYELPEGSRIYEAIEAAGGFEEDGAREYLNLAELLQDGMKLDVPDVSQAEQWMAQGIPPAPSQSAGTDKVNLNTASREELMKLRGIGESRAEDIIRYRDTCGGFQSIEDIMNVSGIKDAAFEKIKDSITV